MFWVCVALADSEVKQGSLLYKEIPLTSVLVTGNTVYLDANSVQQFCFLCVCFSQS